MSIVSHLLGKDLRRLRWGVIAWCAVIAVRTITATAGADIALDGLGPQIGIAELSGWLGLISLTILALLISGLVHDEPLVGPDAFWLTRPIAPGALLRAKLLFASLIFVAVPAAGALIVPAVFGTSPGDVARTIPVWLLNQVIAVSLLMALAAVTPSLTRYAVAIVAVIAAVVVAMTSTVVVMMWQSEVLEGGGAAGFRDPRSAVLGAIAIAVAAVAVIVYQYRTRRLGRALAIAGVGLAVVLALEQWSWPAALPLPFEMAAAPPDTPALTVSLDGSRPRIIDAFRFRSRTAPGREIAAPASVSGVPAAFTVRTILAQARLELPDGITLGSGGGNSSNTMLVSNSSPGSGSSIAAALGGVRMLTTGDARPPWPSEHWPILLRVDEEDFARYRAEPGRLSANLDVVFERAVVRGALPLADGAVADISLMRTSIARVIRRAAGCTILLRRSYVEPLLSPPRYRFFSYVLHNRTRREAAAAFVRPLDQEGLSAGGFYVAAPHVGGRGFVLEQYELQFPAGVRPDDRAADLDAAWLAGAELVILETIPAGRISRAVTIDAFRMVP